ncbi:MAG: TetR/AcrR family transcriptional regulator [Spirochaetes bacterium]|nr:TetR/AcrR family transcriptional regulator [Spirochaetota bacterium]
MPPKFKFTKDEIIESSINLIRQKGWNALSTRTLAYELGSSARPIYSFFKSMEELEEELVKKAVELLYECMVRERTGDRWIDHGIGYVMFAQEEKHLFRGINNEKNIKYFKKYGDLIWNTLTSSLSDYPAFQGLSAEHIYKIQGTRWLFAHGLAFQVSNPPPETWDIKTIITVMQEGSLAILDGLRNRMNSSE